MNEIMIVLGLPAGRWRHALTQGVSAPNKNITSTGLVLVARAAALLALLGIPPAAHAAAWGGFDESRLERPGVVLEDGDDHGRLREILASNDDTLAASTPELTPSYLGGVDVFFTSKLSGLPLSGEERTALEQWLSDGGTLVVAADQNAELLYEGVTAPYELWGYVPHESAVAVAVAEHRILDGVEELMPRNAVTFTFGTTALALARLASEDVFMAVRGPDAGFCSASRILVVGDHDLFTDEWIGVADHDVLVANMVGWASDPVTNCCGNGIVEPGEECDDGNSDESDECSSVCGWTNWGTTTGLEPWSDDSSSGGSSEGASTGLASGSSGVSAVVGDTETNVMDVGGEASGDFVPRVPACECAAGGRTNGFAWLMFLVIVLLGRLLSSTSRRSRHRVRASRRSLKSKRILGRRIS